MKGLPHEQDVFQVNETMNTLLTPTFLENFHHGHPQLWNLVEAKKCCLEFEYLVPDIETHKRAQWWCKSQMKIGMFEFHLACPHAFSQSWKNLFPVVQFEMCSLKVVVELPTDADNQQ